MENEPIQRPSSSKINRILGFFLIAALIAALIFAARYFNVQELLKSALAWIDSLGFWAPVTFIVIYILSTVLFIPGSILTLGAGVVFGVILGSIYVFIGATLGATAAFLVGRYLA
ncbi:MAG: TVP38/TMEM64 family protein, partial [Cyanobacteriota bacterium]